LLFAAELLLVQLDRTFDCQAPDEALDGIGCREVLARKFVQWHLSIGIGEAEFGEHRSFVGMHRVLLPVARLRGFAGNFPATFMGAVVHSCACVRAPAHA
jgi:hypothetical protein